MKNNKIKWKERQKEKETERRKNKIKNKIKKKGKNEKKKKPETPQKNLTKTGHELVGPAQSIHSGKRGTR